MSESLAGIGDLVFVGVLSASVYEFLPGGWGNGAVYASRSGEDVADNKGNYVGNFSPLHVFQFEG